MTRALILFSAILVFISEPAAARSLICTLGESMKAVNGDVKSTITFTNRTKDKQTVYWVDYEGKRHNYQELDPGESYDQPTFMTHPWVVTGKNGKCVGVYLAERQKITVEAGYKGKKKIAKTKRKVAKAKPVAKVKKRIAEPKVKPDDYFKPKKSVATEPLPEPLPSEPRTVQRDDRVASLGDEYDDSDYRETEDARRGVTRDDDNDFGDEPYEGVSRKTDRGYDDEDERRSSDLDSYEDADDGVYREDEYRPEPRTPLRRNGRLWQCGQGSSPTEEAICDDRRLTRLDNELNQLYDSLLREVRPRARRKLQFVQRRWLRRRDQCGRRVDCIEVRTQRRLARLNARLERVIARRNFRRSRIERCVDGFLTPDGRCVRDEPRLRRGPTPPRLVCGPGRYDNGRGRCVRRRGSLSAFGDGQLFNGVPN